MAGLPKDFDVNNPVCGTCGSDMHDNREDKENPKAPDFRCKDKDCLDDKGYRTAYFVAPFKGGRGGAKKGAVKAPADRPEPASEEAGPAAAATRPTVHHYTPGEKQAIRAARVEEYVALMRYLKKEMVTIALGDANAMVALDMGNVQATTYSVWGILKDAKALRDPVEIIAKAKAAAEAKRTPSAPKAAPEAPAPIRRPAAAVGTKAATGGHIPAGFEEFPSALEDDDDELPF